MDFAYCWQENGRPASGLLGCGPCCYILERHSKPSQHCHVLSEEIRFSSYISFPSSTLVRHSRLHHFRNGISSRGLHPHIWRYCSVAVIYNCIASQPTWSDGVISIVQWQCGIVQCGIVQCSIVQWQCCIHSCVDAALVKWFFLFRDYMYFENHDKMPKITFYLKPSYGLDRMYCKHKVLGRQIF